MTIRLIVLLVTLFIFSCNESIEDYPELIIGKWVEYDNEFRNEKEILDTFEFKKNNETYLNKYKNGSSIRKKIGTWAIIEDTLYLNSRFNKTYGVILEIDEFNKTIKSKEGNVHFYKKVE